MLKELLAEILLEESVSAKDVSNVIDSHNRVIINYHSDGKDEADGARVIEVYAYGLTKAGNPVIRAFQPYGDTTTKVPSWKFFRLDRISGWEVTDQKFSVPASDVYSGLGEFNKNGDKTMSVVYKVARFDDEEVYKTDTEKRMDRLRQQLDNPINIRDLQKPSPVKPKKPELKTDQGVYKTPTERGMESLKAQLANPRKIDLSKFSKPKTVGDNEKEMQDLRNRLGDTSDKINIGDLNKRLSQTPKEPELKGDTKDDIYRTDTERGMDSLRDNIANATKIDLSKIPTK
jgi:hypothetical protein